MSELAQGLLGIYAVVATVALTVMFFAWDDARDWRRFYEKQYDQYLDKYLEASQQLHRMRSLIGKALKLHD